MNNLPTFIEPHVRVGVAVIVRRSNEILMGLRKGSHGAGTWALPGGHVELGEEPIDTALRELYEELGKYCKFGLIDVFDNCPYISTVFQEGKHHITLFFETYLLEGEPMVMEPNKCERWEWVDPGHPPQPLFGNLSKVDLQKWTRL
jgi:8-oxo-dGTP diphosphatase